MYIPKQKPDNIIKSLYEDIINHMEQKSTFGSVDKRNKEIIDEIENLSFDDKIFILIEKTKSAYIKCRIVEMQVYEYTKKLLDENIGSDTTLTIVRQHPHPDFVEYLYNRIKREISKGKEVEKSELIYLLTSIALVAEGEIFEELFEYSIQNKLSLPLKAFVKRNTVKFSDDNRPTKTPDEYLYKLVDIDSTDVKRSLVLLNNRRINNILINDSNVTVRESFTYNNVDYKPYLKKLIFDDDYNIIISASTLINDYKYAKLLYDRCNKGIKNGLISFRKIKLNIALNSKSYHLLNFLMNDSDAEVSEKATLTYNDNIELMNLTILENSLKDIGKIYTDYNNFLDLYYEGKLDRKNIIFGMREFGKPLLDILVYDKSETIRAEVARRKHIDHLKILAYDDSVKVKREVAKVKNKEVLEILYSDRHIEIRDLAMKFKNKTLLNYVDDFIKSNDVYPCGNFLKHKFIAHEVLNNFNPIDKFDNVVVILNDIILNHCKDNKIMEKVLEVLHLKFLPILVQDRVISFFLVYVPDINLINLLESKFELNENQKYLKKLAEFRNFNENINLIE